MKRRSGATDAASKARGRKTQTPKRRVAPKAMRPQGSTVASREPDVAQVIRERDEALEQQAATSEVLQVISRFPGDVQPVFAALLEKAVLICDATFGHILRYDGDALHLIAAHNSPPAFVEARAGLPVRPSPNGPFDRALKTKKVVHVADVAAEKNYTDQRHPTIVEAVELGGVRTILFVPLLKGDDLIGIFALQRREVRPFTDKQIALVENFAAQTVIAVENARLLNELRQRTTDLAEALEQQTATSDVLQTISRSPGDLQPVFANMLEKAVRVCDATFGNIYRWESDAGQLVATHNTPPALKQFRRVSPLIHPDPSTGFGRMVATKEVVQIVNAVEEPVYLKRSNPNVVASIELGGIRSYIAVPMLKDGQLIGAFILCRQEVRPFTDKQIELVKNFAAQAVIAIENARLLNELRQRTADLTEALDRQTAASEVLQAISSFAGELDPVFQAILTNATRLCEAKYGNLYLFADGAFHLVSAGLAFERLRGPAIYPAPGTGLGRMVRARATVQIADVITDQEYPHDDDDPLWSAVQREGVRTLLCVPMINEDRLIGAVIIFRQEIRPFTDKQIDLVKNFAAQAVIAIENARLLNELRQRTMDLTERTADLTEALEQQTATSEVLQTISSSPGDLEPVFAAMLEKAVRICDASFGNIYRWDGDALHLVATRNTPAKFAEYRKSLPLRRPSPNTASGRMLATKKVVHVVDVMAEPAYVEESDPAYVATVELGGSRTIIAVPMLKEDELIGGFTLFRQEVRPFTEKQIALVTNFANQAVIAIENARLLNELRERTEEVEKLNQHLEQRVADQVGEIERMGRLRRFLPPQVADLIVASGTEKQLESHRREITALFCDLRGFTGFTESADAEDVIALLREYHAAIGEIIIKYSGTLERYAGDGVMVVFNDPVPVEKPALQAVLMALEMREVIRALSEKWRRLGHEIGFGIGIAHGFATLGTIGFEGRFDYAAIGTVANVASRLCDEAKPGQILISPRVFMAVEDAVAVEPVGEFTLKGIRRPLAAYNVLATISA